MIVPLALLALSQGALAQDIPGAGSQLRQVPPPTPAPLSVTPQIRIEESAGASTRASDSVRVVVNELRLAGVTAFATDELIAIAKFTPGAEVSLADLEAMALRITEHYRQHGYFVARAYLPAQDITLRVVTIAVREGNYGQVNLRNSSRLDDGVANGLLEGLDGGKIITLAPLEHRLLLLSDLPGIDVTSTLAPGTEPGTSDLIVDIAPGRAVTGSIDADNAGNPYTGEYRVGAVGELQQSDGARGPGKRARADVRQWPPVRDGSPIRCRSGGPRSARPTVASTTSLASSSNCSARMVPRRSRACSAR